MRNETAIVLATAVLVCAQPVSIVAQDRVEYCGSSCQQPGRGYTSRASHAALDSDPTDPTLTVCDVLSWRRFFSSPGWQELPINDNLQTISTSKCT